MASSSSSTKTFNYCIDNKDYEISCRTPCTVLEALKTDSNFQTIHQKEMQPKQTGKNKEQKTKDILIQRGVPPRAAVSPHFPCQLLTDEERLTIQYITKQGDDDTGASPQTVKSGDLVTFNIQTQGGRNITRTIMKNTNIPKDVFDVCVYAYKGETLSEALERDGRFADVVQKHCNLTDINRGHTVGITSLVDNLDERHFKINRSHAGPIGQASNTDSNVQNVSKSIKSEERESEDIPQENQDQAQKPSGTEKAAVDMKDSQESASNDNAKNAIKTIRNKLNITIPETEQEQLYLEKLLEEVTRVRSQFQQVSKQLKKQNDIWNIFREEYDKSARSCTEVHTVKTLMMLADSVCMIRVNTKACGTGFILFHIQAPNTPDSTLPKPRQSFILTNAHVVMAAVESSGRKLHDGITLTAEFEEWKDGKKTPHTTTAKNELVAFKYSPADHLDFALLELEDSKEWQLPDGLLTKYRPSAPRGGICIIGHPDGGDKKMDPTFIVEPQNQYKSVTTHIIKNEQLKPFMQKKCLEERWTFDSSRITYNTCFFHGSSGSPVFDSLCSLNGIHSGGYSYKGHAGETRSIIEYAYPPEPTFECIITQSAERGRKDVSQYIQSQPNISEALRQRNQSKTLISGLDTKTFQRILDIKSEDKGTTDEEPMDTS
ncbi:protein FAM111A-like [Colossoma macropomum]|uniref:protein FAM111A-like n=1 Tax=Colossoma macropomum TaxID=42526 RepID=UPI00186433B4|nr:protein FAM111A-like [Colossoma macropomum]